MATLILTSGVFEPPEGVCVVVYEDWTKSFEEVARKFRGN